jgi:quinol monooxygenase YgiN
MIVVTGVVKTTQQDIDTLRNAIGVMETASRAEAGCEDYTFSAELSDPEALRITEKWDNVESLKAHMTTPHMAEFQKAMGAHPPASLEVKFYVAEEIQPF